MARSNVVGRKRAPEWTSGALAERKRLEDEAKAEGRAKIGAGKPITLGLSLDVRGSRPPRVVKVSKLGVWAGHGGHPAERYGDDYLDIRLTT